MKSFYFVLISFDQWEIATRGQLSRNINVFYFDKTSFIEQLDLNNNLFQRRAEEAGKIKEGGYTPQVFTTLHPLKFPWKVSTPPWHTPQNSQGRREKHTRPLIYCSHRVAPKLFWNFYKHAIFFICLKFWLVRLIPKLY